MSKKREDSGIVKILLDCAKRYKPKKEHINLFDDNLSNSPKMKDTYEISFIQYCSLTGEDSSNPETLKKYKILHPAGSGTGLLQAGDGEKHVWGKESTCDFPICNHYFLSFAQYIALTGGDAYNPKVREAYKILYPSQNPEDYKHLRAAV